MLYHITYIIWRVLIAPILGVKISGRENIPKTGAFIIVANHITIYDPCLIIIAARLGIRPIRWCAKLSLFSIQTAVESLAPDKHPIRAWCVGFVISCVTKYSFAIPVEREEDSSVSNTRHSKYSNVNRRAVVKILKTLKYHDGVVGIFPEGGLDKEGTVHQSFVEIAQRAQVPILPACMSKWGVVFGKPIKADTALTAHEIRQKASTIMQTIYAMRG